MNKAKRKQLERRGWKVGSASEFLGLSPEESRLIELKLALSHSLRERREARKLTQIELAQQLRSSQSNNRGRTTVTVLPERPHWVGKRPIKGAVPSIIYGDLEDSEFFTLTL